MLLKILLNHCIAMLRAQQHSSILMYFGIHSSICLIWVDISMHPKIPISAARAVLGSQMWRYLTEAWLIPALVNQVTFPGE